jgi:hypothetical protein
MFNLIDKFVIGSQTRVSKYLETLKQEEKGASDMVAIIVVIVIILAVAGIFRTQLTTAVTNVFSRLNTFIGTE